MQVKVLYFGVLRDWSGAADEIAELNDGASVRDLLRVLLARPSKHAMADSTEADGMTALWQSLAVAVNREYASASIVLRDGDEVALLPPVSGGSDSVLAARFVNREDGKVAC
jgi:molybdopterin converting factor small subunit